YIPTFSFVLKCSGHPPDLHSFPTRRSSDLHDHAETGEAEAALERGHDLVAANGQRRVHEYVKRHALALARGELVGAELRVIGRRSEEHTSELQSLAYLVCRLLLEKKKKKNI